VPHSGGAVRDREPSYDKWLGRIVAAFTCNLIASSGLPQAVYNSTSRWRPRAEGPGIRRPVELVQAADQQWLGLLVPAEPGQSRALCVLSPSRPANDRRAGSAQGCVALPSPPQSLRRNAARPSNRFALSVYVAATSALSSPPSPCDVWRALIRSVARLRRTIGLDQPVREQRGAAGPRRVLGPQFTTHVQAVPPALQLRPPGRHSCAARRSRHSRFRATSG